jgi:predicted acyltransferase
VANTRQDVIVCFFKSARVALLGLALVTIGLAWGSAYQILHPLKEMPGWYMVEEPYRPAYRVFSVGISVTFLAGIVRIVEVAIEFSRYLLRRRM